MRTLSGYSARFFWKRRYSASVNEFFGFWDSSSSSSSEDESETRGFFFLPRSASFVSLKPGMLNSSSPPSESVMSPSSKPVSSPFLEKSVSSRSSIPLVSNTSAGPLSSSPRAASERALSPDAEPSEPKSGRSSAPPSSEEATVVSAGESK